MRTAMRRRLLGMAALASLTLAATAAGPLPAETYAHCNEADIAHLEQLVELAKTKKGIPARMKATAMIIAANAQANFGGKDDAKLAALRDAALKVAEAVAKKSDPAAAIAAMKNPPAGGAAKAVKLHTLHKVDLREIMDLFGASAGGGMNIEKDIREFKKPGVKIEPKQAELIGARSVAIAEFAFDMPPAFDAKKKKSDWDGWTKDMKTYGTELTVEAAKGAKADEKKLKTTIGKLDASCVSCHNVFRD